MKTEEILEVLKEVDFNRVKVVEIRVDNKDCRSFSPDKDGWFYHCDDKFYFYSEVESVLGDIIRVDSESVKWICIYEIGDDYTLPNPITSEDGIIVRIYLK